MSDNYSLWLWPEDRYTPSGDEGLWYAPEYKYLKPWLDIATKGLTSDSKARVRDELSAHFDDAVREGIDSGLTKDDAVRRAVESLGPAKKAHRAFRRTYLTTFNDMNLQLLHRRRTIMTVVFTLAAASSMWRLMNVSQKFEMAWFVQAAAFAGIVIALVAWQWIVPRLYLRGLQRRAVGIAAIAQATLWSCLFGMQLPLSRSLGNAGLLIALMIGVVLLFSLAYLPIVRKLEDHPKQPA